MEFDPTAAPVGPPIDEEERERREEEAEAKERAAEGETRESEEEEGAGSSSPAARKARRERERRERRRGGGGGDSEEAEGEEEEEKEKELEKEAGKKAFAAEERLAASFVSFASGRGSENGASSGGSGGGGGSANGGNKPVSGLSVVSGPRGPWEPRRASGAASDVSKRVAGGAKDRARPRGSSDTDADADAAAAAAASAAAPSLSPPPGPERKPAPPPPRTPGLLAAVFGLNASDNAAVNGKLTEPPDLALCSGGDRGQFVLQAVNSAWAVFDAASGDLLAGPFSLYSLFKVPRNSSMTDPGCVFDHAGSRRFFLTVQWYSRAAGSSFAYQVFVVSKSSDPREGFNGVYYVDTSGRAPGLGLKNCALPGGGVVAPAGAPAAASPPPAVSGCLGDYPSYGVDRHALWFGVNHYTFATGRLQGAALYGVRKADLLDARGPAYPRVAVFTSWGDAADAADASPGALRLGFTLQPATPSAGEPFDDRRGGTQYVLASSYFFRTGLPSVVAWAITNTSLIGRGLPGGEAPALSPAVVLPALPLRKPAKVFSGGLRQEAAVAAAAAAAAAGNAAASGAAAAASAAAADGDGGGAGGAGGGGLDLGVQRLDEKDERLQQVTLSGGSLWTNMQTAVEVANGDDKGKEEKEAEDETGGHRQNKRRKEKNAAAAAAASSSSKTVSGIAYFRVEPRWSSSGSFEPVVAQNGYVAVPGHHCVNGAIAASPRSFGGGSGAGDKKAAGGDKKAAAAGGGAGVAAMAFSILGPHYNYSAAFVAIRPDGPGAVVVPRPSQEPLHGFSPKAMRNGDYTGATAAPDGSLWLGAQQASAAVHVTSSGKRQNWETVLVRVDPGKMP